MKALVTGGAGFLGHYIVEQLLDRGDSVRVFTRGNYPIISKIGAELVRGDLQEYQQIKDACKGMDAVFHVASKTSYWGKFKSFYGPNVVGTQNVIAACRAQNISKLIYTSTPSAVFKDENHENGDESIPYLKKYDNNYSLTKAMAEQEVIKANNSKLSTVALRPHAIFGPRDQTLLPRLIDAAKAGRLRQIGDGKNIIDMTYVEDAARAHLLASDALNPDSVVAGSIYFITQDEPINLWSWLNSFFKELNIASIEKELSLKKARKAASLMEIIYHITSMKKEPLLTRSVVNILALNHYYNISKAKNELNYKPQLNMKEATEKTLDFFKNI